MKRRTYMAIAGSLVLLGGGAYWGWSRQEARRDALLPLASDLRMSARSTAPDGTRTPLTSGMIAPRRPLEWQAATTAPVPPEATEVVVLTAVDGGVPEPALIPLSSASKGAGDIAQGIYAPAPATKELKICAFLVRSSEEGVLRAAMVRATWRDYHDQACFSTRFQ